MALIIVVKTDHLSYDGVYELTLRIRDIFEEKGIPCTIEYTHVDNPTTTLGEMDDKLYADIDKKVDDAFGGVNEITEEEYNNLFQQDRTDQFNEVEKDITERSQEYSNGRPLDP